MKSICKVILLCSLQFMLLYSLQIRAAQTVVIIGDDSYPPYSFIEHGVAKGVYVDILKAVFDQLPEYQVTISMMPWKRGLTYIKQGKRLAIFPPYYWPKSRPYMEVYSEPILLETVLVTCNEAILKDARNRWPADYFGLRIATNRGFLAPGPEFFDAVKLGKIFLTETKSTEHGLRMLLLNRIDCYVNSKLTIQWGLKQLQNQQRKEANTASLKFGAVISEQWGYLGYSAATEQFPYRQEFRLKVDEVLRQMKKEGAISQIIERFLNQ
ncbi:MAG: transporter substrate-binding domain-containing protein [Pseudomonadales bacterium]|nr:transporter substrate-binding domain-containing protein [Pseudomonadales bacterium]